MKKIGIYLFANITALLMLTYFHTGFQVTKGFFAFVFLSIVISMINLGVKPFINFLTLPENYVTLGLFNLISNFVLFYLVKFAVPGFEISSGEVTGINTDFLIVPGFHTDLISTVIIAALILSIFAILTEWLLND